MRQFPDKVVADGLTASRSVPACPPHKQVFAQSDGENATLVHSGALLIDDNLSRRFRGLF